MEANRQLPTLASGRITLRATREEDIPALVDLLDEPDIRRWWGHNDAASVRAQMRAQACWTIFVNERVTGWMHAHEERDENYPSVGFDIALSAHAQGRGLGREALRLAIRHFIAGGHHRFSIDPAAENHRAIRAYSAIGFKPVGVLRAYERAPDGTWRDGLLMDLLAAEFIETEHAAPPM